MKGTDKPSPETAKPAASPTPPTPPSAESAPTKHWGQAFADNLNRNVMAERSKLNLAEYVKRANAEILRRNPPKE